MIIKTNIFICEMLHRENLAPEKWINKQKMLLAPAEIRDEKNQHIILLYIYNPKKCAYKRNGVV